MKDAQEAILEVNGLKTYFPIRKGVLRKTVGYVRAVDGVNIRIFPNETVGLVGESGSGKTTTGRSILRLIQPTSGEVTYRDEDQKLDMLAADKQTMKRLRRKIQIIFQDPFSSLNSRMKIRDIIAEPLYLHRVGDARKRTERVADLMYQVGLSEDQMYRYPHEFSGGQRQRIGIARALALEPRLLICDEPVSALDVSVQAAVINLLEELQDRHALAYLFIAHDLSVVEHISDRIMVMYLGKVVETAAAESIYRSPQHPYTEMLLKSIPVADPRHKKESAGSRGTIPDPSNPPSGCSFRTRCPYAQDICAVEEPPLKPIQSDPDHLSACHFAETLDLHGYTPPERLIARQRIGHTKSGD